MKNTNNISKYACDDEEALRFNKEKEDIRSPFFRDIDRILYSLSYIRYVDKTQVFTYKDNDHLSQRMIHVQFVSKIARTIGRELGLNEDLIEAAALGHDLGHIPFGHVGEVFLNNLSLKHNEGYFKHNVHSVRNLMEIENNGNGRNINYQVLDAILCHNGEILDREYKPSKKSIEEFLSDYNKTYKEEKTLLIPGTLEGCVVRISDIIAYIGRDIEDAIRLGYIKLEDIPEDIVNVLGKTNREIINTIILDILNNSKNMNSITMSEDVFKAIFDLKKFNYQNIYYKIYTKEELNNIENMFIKVFNKCLEDLNNENIESKIYKDHLSNMIDKYKENTNERIVIDYIAGMTDKYFINIYESINKD